MVRDGSSGCRNAFTLMISMIFHLVFGIFGTIFRKKKRKPHISFPSMSIW